MDKGCLLSISTGAGGARRRQSPKAFGCRVSEAPTLDCGWNQLQLKIHHQWQVITGTGVIDTHKDHPWFPHQKKKLSKNEWCFQTTTVLLIWKHDPISPKEILFCGMSLTALITFLYE